MVAPQVYSAASRSELPGDVGNPLALIESEDDLGSGTQVLRRFVSTDETFEFVTLVW